VIPSHQPENKNVQFFPLEDVAKTGPASFSAGKIEAKKMEKVRSLGKSRKL
jgi:hypothetical protein